MKAIADTGFLVVFGNRRDSHHRWALEIAQQISEPLLTCEAVLAEAAFHLGNAGIVLAFVFVTHVRQIRRRGRGRNRSCKGPDGRTAHEL